MSQDTFIIEIGLGNDALSGDDMLVKMELARIISGITEKLAMNEDPSGPLRDLNGNKVGNCYYSNC